MDSNVSKGSAGDHNHKASNRGIGLQPAASLENNSVHNASFPSGENPSAETQVTPVGSSYKDCPGYPKICGLCLNTLGCKYKQSTRSVSASPTMGTLPSSTQSPAGENKSAGKQSSPEPVGDSDISTVGNRPDVPDDATTSRFFRKHKNKNLTTPTVEKKQPPSTDLQDGALIRGGQGRTDEEVAGQVGAILCVLSLVVGIAFIVLVPMGLYYLIHSFMENH